MGKEVGGSYGGGVTQGVGGGGRLRGAGREANLHPSAAVMRTTAACCWGYL